MVTHLILSRQIMPEHVESTPEAESDVVTVLGSTGSFPIDAPFYLRVTTTWPQNSSINRLCQFYLTAGFRMLNTHRPLTFTCV